MKPEFGIEWAFRDVQNTFGNGISNVIMEFVQKRSDGMYRSAGAFEIQDVSALSINYPYSGATLDASGLWCESAGLW